jgi:HD-GYP domain-containing protein (c-di-GMP phosphodiesterase class II)
MSINYKKELELASKSMILVHEPEALIRIIVRMIVQKVDITHACILLESTAHDSYIIAVSRGVPGLKIPRGFARMDAGNPLITFFRQHFQTRIMLQGALVLHRGKRVLAKGGLDADKRAILAGALRQMEIFSVVACIPCYYRKELLGMVMLGQKNDGALFNVQELDFLMALASDVAMAIRNAQLFKDLQDQLEKRKRLFLNTTLALTAAIEAKDHYTHGHTTRVTEFSLAVARELAKRGLLPSNSAFFENLQIASLLHDIGKIGIPESILNKQGPLNADERKRMQEHPVVGVTILESIPELKECVPGIRNHHERFDGTGYPDGLCQSQIPLMASIISVADAFDAMTTDRPYRRGLSREESVKEIRRETGRQFNPLVSTVLVKLCEEKTI